MKAKVVGIGLVILFLTNPSPAHAADRPWTEVKSAHFTIVSDSTEKTARTIAWQFEQVRAAVQTLCPWAGNDVNRPLVVIAVRDEDEMKALAPKYWEQKGAVHPASVAVTAPNRYYVALRSDIEMPNSQGGVNPYLDAYWSYAAIRLGSGLKRDLPEWFTRGFSGVLGNTIVRDSYVEVGRVIPWDLQQLRTDARIKLRDLVLIDRSSPWITQASRLPFFDAESWALMHFLLFGEAGKHRPQLDQFLSAVLDGKPTAAAVGAFGDLEALEQAFMLYISRGLFDYTRFSVDVNVKPEGFAARPMPAPEAAAMRAAFHTAMGRPVEARAMIDDARKAAPALAAPNDVEAMLLDSERKPQEALAAYAKAIELGSTDFYTYYRWAVLSQRPDLTTDARTKVQQAADRSAQLNTAYGPAYELSAAVKLQLGRPGDAFATVQHAVALDPGRMAPRFYLARALQALGQPDQALAQAKEALTLASNDVDRRNAQQLIDAISRAPSAPANATGSSAAGSNAAAPPK